MPEVIVTLSYSGAKSDQSEIDLYDIGQGIIGFQRSLALTTHLILNDEIITQSPSLKGAQILALPSQAGSWKIPAAVVIAGSIYTAGTAPRDTPIGNLISSAYDFVISESLGFHVDYSKTLGEQYEELQRSRVQVPPLRQERLDSLTEKCESAVREMHRPIVKSETATEATIQTQVGSIIRQFSSSLSRETFEYISYTEEREDAIRIRGWVSSYNINTYKGRIFTQQDSRPIPFELAESCRDVPSVARVTNSLTLNAQRRTDPAAKITMRVLPRVAGTGRLKSYRVIAVLE